MSRISKGLNLMSILGVGAAMALLLGSFSAAHGEEIGTLDDSGGGHFKLSSLDVTLSPGTDFRFHDWLRTNALYRGSMIYAYPGGLPIRQSNGVVAFVGVDLVASLKSDGARTTIQPLKGSEIAGVPLAGAKITAKTALGEVSLPLVNVRALDLDPQAAGRAVSEHEEKFRREYSSLFERGWPVEFKGRALATLRDGAQLTLDSPAFVYEISFSDCDTNFVPCKPKSYTRWELTAKLPVLVGASEVEVDFANVRAFTFSPGSQKGSKDLGVEIELRDGGRSVAKLRSAAKPVAFLGLTSFGYANIPVESVMTLTLEP